MLKRRIATVALFTAFASSLTIATAPVAAANTPSAADLISTLLGVLSSGSAAPKAAPPTIGPNVIKVGTKIAVPVGSGRTLGPNLYARSSNGEADVAFSWKAAAPRGNDKGCQMEVTVTGPTSFPTVKTATCTGYYATSFNGSDNGVTVKVPGRYTVTAIDRVSRTSGVSTFTVQ